MARDAIARLYDVDAAQVKLTILPDGTKTDYVPGTIQFVAKKGNSVHLDKMSESIAATRLSGGPNLQGTSMKMDYLEITARGEVVARDKDLVLKVSGSGEEFLLADDASAKEAIERLRKAVANGAKVTTVTGRVQGWSGVFPQVLAAWAKTAGQKRTLGVTDFEISKN
jgi:hypothetical protein